MTAGWTSWEFRGDCWQPFEGCTLQGQLCTSEIPYKAEMTEKPTKKSPNLCIDITKKEKVIVEEFLICEETGLGKWEAKWLEKGYYSSNYIILPGSPMPDVSSQTGIRNEMCLSECVTHIKATATVRARVGTGCFLLFLGGHEQTVPTPYLMASASTHHFLSLIF